MIFSYNGLTLVMERVLARIKTPLEKSGSFCISKHASKNSNLELPNFKKSKLKSVNAKGFFMQNWLASRAFVRCFYNVLILSMQITLPIMIMHKNTVANRNFIEVLL